jgi:pimeloyl-ACP methyl ester carboxylesterase
MVYFISGLGADEKVFQFLRLDSIQQIHIKWLKTDPIEGLRAYASRLTAQIDTSQEVILIGVSFGGLIAQEIGNSFPVSRL